ncbi:MULTISPECIES: hypothetical protein [unclassified Pseudofrankia]|nr:MULTISPECIES: hypothetical protein [unclassified Pseudofrankia]MDT3440676.1 hypothetical protein [Pseudofrankia sp. BMG5.37]
MADIGLVGREPPRLRPAGVGLPACYDRAAVAGRPRGVDRGQWTT